MGSSLLSSAFSAEKMVGGLPPQFFLDEGLCEVGGGENP